MDKGTPRTALALEFLTNVIKPVLNDVGLGGIKAEQLLLGTAIQESGLEYRRQKCGGPGLGLYQMEPATHDDIWNNYLKHKQKLSEKILNYKYHENNLVCLEVNDCYATLMARVHYLRVPHLLPDARDVKQQARYWKKYYNTPQGKGKEEDYIRNWELFDAGKLFDC